MDAAALVQEGAAKEKRRSVGGVLRCYCRKIQGCTQAPDRQSAVKGGEKNCGRGDNGHRSVGGGTYRNRPGGEAKGNIGGGGRPAINDMNRLLGNRAKEILHSAEEVDRRGDGL